MSTAPTSSAEKLCLRQWGPEDRVHVCKKERHSDGTHVCMCESTLLEESVRTGKTACT